MKTDLMKISKRMTYLLRHDPCGLKMTDQGWVELEDLIKLLNTDMETVDKIVSSDNKQRYSYDETGTKIRANQGHSIDFVDIKFIEKIPPMFLYHGTTPTYVPSIMKDGLLKMSRHHVHLSDNINTAKNVGKRHSKYLEPVILKIDSYRMHYDGYKFYLSDNKVWLTSIVPPQYISLCASIK